MDCGVKGAFDLELRTAATDRPLSGCALQDCGRYIPRYAHGTETSKPVDFSLVCVAWQYMQPFENSTKESVKATWWQRSATYPAGGLQRFLRFEPGVWQYFLLSNDV